MASDLPSYDRMSIDEVCWDHADYFVVEIILAATNRERTLYEVQSEDIYAHVSLLIIFCLIAD